MKSCTGSYYEHTNGLVINTWFCGFKTCMLRNNFSLPVNCELSLINTCCWRADLEILMHDGGAGVH